MEPQVYAEAYAFRQLVKHLQARHDVQNIEIMNLSGFCRNCLSKWLLAGSQAVGFAKIDSYEAACEAVYGMPLKDWKTKHQQPATPEQLALFEQNKALHAQTSVDEEAVQSLLSDVCCQSAYL